MGKKSLRRNRTAQQPSAKHSKSSNPSIGERYESIRETNVASIAEQLVKFPSSDNEGSGQLLIRLIKFWVEGGSERREIAWNMTSLCSGCFGGHRIQIDLMHLVMIIILDHINIGEFKLARLWMLTYFVFVREMSGVGTEAEWLNHLYGMMNDIKNNDYELQRKSAKFYRGQETERSSLETYYYYSKSVCRMTQWAFVAQFVCGVHSICSEPFVDIKVVYYTDFGQITGRTWVNPTTKLKTLLWRLQGELKSQLGHHKIILKDKCGLAKGLLVMKYYGNKTLEHIGFEMNDVLHIVSANATEVKDTAGSSSNDAPHVEVGSTSKSSSQKAKKKEKQRSISSKKNVSKSSRRSTVKPSASKKQGNENQPTYCSNIDQDRVKHSMLLTLVFQEATELFQERRQRLNELSLKKCKPKEKSAKAKPNANVSEHVSHCCLPNTGGKAGKSAFSVLVGHEDYLYKSSKNTKHVQKYPYIIDLHGCTRDEALNKLNDLLHSWMEQAMKESPWTVEVNIIAGGGNQIVAEAVEHWIRKKRNVAKRFT